MIHAAGFQIQPKLLWECYGRPGGVFPPDGCLLVEGIQERPHLNGQLAEVVDWYANRGRFQVKVDGVSMLLKPEALRAPDTSDESAWLKSESHFRDLPACVVQRVAVALPARTVAALGASSRALRVSLCLCAEARSLWLTLLQRGHGRAAVQVVRATHSLLDGLDLYRVARGLKRLFERSFELVEGGVDQQAGGFGVVACPVARNLANVNVGAQGAVRHVAGPAAEDAIARLRAERLNELDLVTLVHGGLLAEKLALTVTEIPYEVLQIFQMPYVGDEQRHGTLMSWLTRLHAALLHTVRAAGYRSVSMPTLCTGGIGIPVQFVAVAAVRSVYWDFCAHPTDPMRVRLCCFELGHLRMARAVKMEVLDHFYRPEVAEELVGLLHRSDGVGEGEVTPEDLPLSDEDPEDM